ncbi:22967_t:CDS:1, partial [Gigaspora margarita]
GEDTFVLPLSRYQPYSTQRPKKNQKKSKSQIEKRLRTNPPIAPASVLPQVEVAPLLDYPLIVPEVPSV